MVWRYTVDAGLHLGHINRLLLVAYIINLAAHIINQRKIVAQYYSRTSAVITLAQLRAY